MILSRCQRRDTNPGYIGLNDARPEADHEAPKKVLLVEARAEMRQLLSGLLQRRGLEVTEQRPEETDLLHDCPYDAVIFNSDQKRLRRQRWLFGFRPPKRRTRLVALHNGSSNDAEPELQSNEVDASLPYPVSISELINAVLGN